MTDTKGLLHPQTGLLRGVELRMPDTKVIGCTAGELRRADAALRKIAPLEAEIANLKAALDRYGDHDEDCGRIEKDGPRCTCGFLEAMSGAADRIQALEEALGYARQALEGASASIMRSIAGIEQEPIKHITRAKEIIGDALTGSTTPEEKK